MNLRIQICKAFMILAAVASCSLAQPSPGRIHAADPAADSRIVFPLSKLPGMVLHDQGRIFTSPARMHPRDLAWIAPLSAGLSVLALSDRRNMQERIHTNALARSRSLTVSNVGTGSLLAIPAVLYWSGWRHGDDSTRSTALQGFRAIADTVVAAELIRTVARRERPSGENSSGDFFRAGALSSSFPSMHAAVSWAVASVVSERYPGWLTRVLAYGLAGGVSLSRVTSYQHFPADAVAGSALGWLIGRHVARSERASCPACRLYRPEPAGRTDPHGDVAGEAEPESFRSSGSVYVPLDSWVYGALDRLAAFGLIPSQIAGLRPWTRAECGREMREADSLLKEAGKAGFVDEAGELLTALRRELDSDGGSPAVVLESVYFRNGVIAGPMLNDSFHFGQTWINDFGRPYGRGWNSYGGFTARAASGRFFAYVRGEYQQAPGGPADSLAVRETIARLDGTPLRQASPVAETERFRTLEAYAGVRVGDLEFSVGKQAMWWGPTYDAPLAFSNNAEPAKNFKVSMVHPVRLPGVFGYLGDIRGEFVMGKLGGHQYTWRPWFNAQKLTFKLTGNLELGFTRWSIFWGVGHPITARSFIRNFTSTTSPRDATGAGASDPGDRKAGFDFRYRIPGLRNWLTVYSDSYCDDDPSPLAAPRRAAISPGIYLSHVPGIPRLDFRVEAPSTQPMATDLGGTFIYYNGQYRSGNTNYGRLMGNAVGRDGRAIQAWSSYHFSARTKAEAGYRELKVSSQFLPGGSTQSDGTLKVSLQLGRSWSAGIQFQYERFWVPVLGGPHRNLSGVVQLAWEPNLLLLKRDHQQ